MASRPIQGRSDIGFVVRTHRFKQWSTVRPILKYRLKTLFVATLVAACSFAYATNRYRKMHAANIAIDAVGKMRSDKTESTPLIRELVGDDRYFKNISCVDLGPLPFGRTNVAFKDQDLANLVPYMNAFSSFRTLRLVRTRVTDDGLAHLARLNRLETLHLESPSFTDVGISKLQSVSTLKHLIVACDAVTDDALIELQVAIPDLEVQHASKGGDYVRTKP